MIELLVGLLKALMKGIKCSISPIPLKNWHIINANMFMEKKSSKPISISVVVFLFLSPRVKELLEEDYELQKVLVTAGKARYTLK